jgi:transcriptional regulator with XRE-family HTH domain
MGNARIEMATTKLATQTGVHRATVWRWRSGKTRPSRLALARLDELGVTLPLPPKRRQGRRGTVKASDASR